MSDADKVTMTTDDMGDETVGPKVATPEEIAVWRKNLLGLMTTQQMISVFRYIDTLKAEVTRLRGLCVKSDGLFGLWRYRFKSTPMPDDLIGEIEEHIGNLRRASKGEV